MEEKLGTRAQYVGFDEKSETSPRARKPSPLHSTRRSSYGSISLLLLYVLVSSDVMDALFSLPALSFLIIPTFSSYSTSLNLLFFYLTWSTLVLSHPPLKVEILGTLAVRLLFYIIPSTLFLFFDGVLPSAAVGLKAQGDVALPSNGGKGKWWKVALVSVGNVLLGVALQAGGEALFTEVLHIRSALRVTTTLPMPWGIAKDLVRGLLLREVRSRVLARFAQHANAVVRFCNTASIVMVYILPTHR